MKQMIQSLKDGRTSIVDIPAPKCRPEKVLVQTSVSLVSAGTERMLVKFGKGNLVQKAKSQPEKVKQVIEKARSDGVVSTYEAVRSKLDQPLALGYCNVGRVIESGVREFSSGDRVVSNGPHAQVVSVSKNLCARIPDEVSDEAASFTVLAAIGLQGIRLAQPTLGECVVVTGLGLIGLLSVQLLRAQGCRVLGIDFDPQRRAMAKSFGAEVADPAKDNIEAVAQALSRGAGVDAVLITASTQSNEPVAQAARMCRKRGRIVLVGVVGLQLNRADFYEKELSFQVSCSYGPGRYDPAYEDSGHDYPIGFVRWTEQRNFEAVLDLMASGGLDVEPLISHRFDLHCGAEAMDLLTSGEPSLGILLNYLQSPAEEATVRKIRLNEPNADADTYTCTVGSVGLLGAGNYASRTLMPAIMAAGGKLHTVVSDKGVSATHFGAKFGFEHAASDAIEVYNEAGIDTIVIATRHNAHAQQALKALKAGKHVFCEKPLCLTHEELTEIETELLGRPGQKLVVGFNRRFAPQVVKMKSLLNSLDQPKSILITVNAGDIPADHWTQDPKVGGGRVLGEACHFVDLARHLAGHPIVAHSSAKMGRHPAVAIRDDKVSIALEFDDGSVATILYLANGHRAFPKERIEVFAAGRVLQLDNFRKLRGWGWAGFTKMHQMKQDKGAHALIAKFIGSIREGSAQPIAKEEIIEVTRITIEIANECR